METFDLIADIKDFESEERKLIAKGWQKSTGKSGGCKPVNIDGVTYYSQEMSKLKK